MIIVLVKSLPSLDKSLKLKKKALVYFDECSIDIPKDCMLSIQSMLDMFIRIQDIQNCICILKL
jgi:hypothetical protein